MSASKIPSDLGMLLPLGWGIAVWITGGVLLGRWAGTSWGWEPWGTLGGALLGIAGSGLTVYRIVRRLDQKPRGNSDNSDGSNGIPNRESKKPRPPA